MVPVPRYIFSRVPVPVPWYIFSRVPLPIPGTENKVPCTTLIAYIDLSLL